MAHDSFDTWFDTVQKLAPFPVTPDDRWYDAFLYMLAPQEALQLIRPQRTQGWLQSFWASVGRFFA